MISFLVPLRQLIPNNHPSLCKEIFLRAFKTLNKQNQYFLSFSYNLHLQNARKQVVTWEAQTQTHVCLFLFLEPFILSLLNLLSFIRQYYLSLKVLFSFSLLFFFLSFHNLPVRLFGCWQRRHCTPQEVKQGYQFYWNFCKIVMNLKRWHKISFILLHSLFVL